MIIQGIAQVLSSLAVVEISPDGYEASVQLGTDAAAIGKSCYCKMLQELDCTQNCMADKCGQGTGLSLRSAEATFASH